MKYLYIFSFFLFSCAQSPEDRSAKKATAVDDTKETPSQIEDLLNQKNTVKTDIISNSCLFDSLRFTEKMGMGLMVIGFMKPYNYYPVDSIIISDEFNQYAIKHYDLAGEYWGIKINEEDYENYIKHFQRASFGNGFEFIWKSGLKEDSNVVIQSYRDGKEFKVESSAKFYLISWNNYLIESFVSLDQEVEVRNFPNDSSQLSKQANNGYFTVSNVKNNWVELTYLDPKDPEMKNKLNPCGWAKWYCNDSVRIQFLNDIDMEPYYLFE